jgi:hypothetical protein
MPRIKKFKVTSLAKPRKGRPRKLVEDLNRLEIKALRWEIDDLKDERKSLRKIVNAQTITITVMTVIAIFTVIAVMAAQ